MLFLDCEFNGHGGKLISMGIVSDKNSREFYEVLPVSDLVFCDKWVLENVIPFLGKKPVNIVYFRKTLVEYLRLNIDQPIIADSPADFMHLLDLLHTMVDGKYQMENIELDLKLVMSGGLYPQIPHNALSDAKALMKWYLQDKTNYVNLQSPAEKD